MGEGVYAKYRQKKRKKAVYEKILVSELRRENSPIIHSRFDVF